MGEPDDEMVIHNWWWRDMYLNLYFDNWPWANMIWGAEWLCKVDWTRINDPVLLSLLCMGILDWTGPNDWLYQATPAIQHSTTMHLCILPQIMKLESRVRKLDVRLFDSLNLFFSRLMMQSGSGMFMGLRSIVLRPMLRRVVKRPCWPPTGSKRQLGKQLNLCWKVGSDSWLDWLSIGRAPSPQDLCGGIGESLGSLTDHPSTLPGYNSRVGGNRCTVGCVG